MEDEQSPCDVPGLCAKMNRRCDVCDPFPADSVNLPEASQPIAYDASEQKLQAVAKRIGAQYAAWEGIGARDVEEVLRQCVRAGLVPEAALRRLGPAVRCAPGLFSG